MTLAWTRIGRTTPLHVASFPGGNATVHPGEGGKWEGVLLLRVQAGDAKKAKAKLERLLAAVEREWPSTP